MKNNKLKNFVNRHTAFWMLSPYAILFLLFIIIPAIAAIALSFTYFNTIDTPKWVGLDNYIALFTNDTAFMQDVIPNTIVYALFVGVGGYILSFILAWSLAQTTHKIRTILTIAIYSPSMTGGILISTVWAVIFNGEKSGYLNYWLMKFNLINEPVQWLQSEKYLLPIMIFISLWSSMGVGFLAMLSGIVNGNHELYEAGYIDGISNRFQEVVHITIPMAKPQMMFSAVMAVVNTFQSAGIGPALSGSNPTPNNAGQLIVTHIDDYGFLRYEMGYAAAVSVVLFLFIYLMNQGSKKLFGNSDY